MRRSRPSHMKLSSLIKENRHNNSCSSLDLKTFFPNQNYLLVGEKKHEILKYIEI